MHHMRFGGLPGLAVCVGLLCACGPEEPAGILIHGDMVRVVGGAEGQCTGRAPFAKGGPPRILFLNFGGGKIVLSSATGNDNSATNAPNTMTC